MKADCHRIKLFRWWTVLTPTRVAKEHNTNTINIWLLWSAKIFFNLTALSCSQWPLPLWRTQQVTEAIKTCLYSFGWILISTQKITEAIKTCLYFSVGWILISTQQVTEATDIPAIFFLKHYKFRVLSYNFLCIIYLKQKRTHCSS